jgi:hypothetical protein
MEKIRPNRRAWKCRAPRPMLAVLPEAPAGPLNYLIKLYELYARGKGPAPGELHHVNVRHHPDCPMLHGIRSCLCDPEITFHSEWPPVRVGGEK